jgi:hypothetical protein
MTGAAFLWLLATAISPAELSEWVCATLREELPETLLSRFPDENAGGAIPKREPTGRSDHKKWSYSPDRFRVELEYREQTDHPVKLNFRLRVESREPQRWKIFETVEDAASWLAPLGPVVREGDSRLAVRERADSGEGSKFLVEVDVESQSILIDWPHKWLAVHPNPLYQKEFGPDYGQRFCARPRLKSPGDTQRFECCESP